VRNICWKLSSSSGQIARSTTSLLAGRAALSRARPLRGLAAGLILLAILAKRARWLALSWLLPYGAFMLLAMRPDDPRKVLPAIPPMLLLLAGIRPKALAAAAS